MRDLVRRNPWFFAAIVVAAALLRAIFIHYFPSVANDSRIYGDIAKNWLLHGIYGVSSGYGISPTYIRLPGYPAFLAFVFAIFGVDHYRTVLVVQLFVDLGTCFLCASIALQLLGERSARVAFVLAALCPFLANYAAAAIMMPYARFHAAAEALGYDFELLQARFGAGFEQVAHRLTTLQRPGARGVPFFLLRVDRAGNVSKRFAAQTHALAAHGGGCPLWVVHAAFDRPGSVVRQVVVTEDGAQFLTVARTVRTYAAPYGETRPEFAIALSCDLAHARALVYADGVDLSGARATPIGLGCASCARTACRQRSLPPTGVRLRVDERSRGVTPFRFASSGEA